MEKILIYYNIQNNLTIIIYRKMQWRWKGLTLNWGVGGGHEQIIIVKGQARTYKLTKVTTGRLGSVCVRRGRHGKWGGGGGAGGGSGAGGGGGVVV